MTVARANEEIARLLDEIAQREQRIVVLRNYIDISNELAGGAPAVVPTVAAPISAPVPATVPAIIAAPMKTAEVPRRLHPPVVKKARQPHAKRGTPTVTETMLAWAREIVADAGRPMKVPEIYEKMVELGYQIGGNQPIPYLRSVLTKGRESGLVNRPGIGWTYVDPETLAKLPPKPSKAEVGSKPTDDPAQPGLLTKREPLLAAVGDMLRSHGMRLRLVTIRDELLEQGFTVGGDNMLAMMLLRSGRYESNGAGEWWFTEEPTAPVVVNAYADIGSAPQPETDIGSAPQPES